MTEMKPVRVAWQIFAALLLAILLLPLLGCATDRYLSADQDATFRSVCEKQGCQVIPTPIWNQIEIMLKRLGLMGDA